MANIRQFIVTASGKRKSDGKPYSRCAEIMTTETGGYLSDRSVRFLDEVHPVGTRLKVTEAPLVVDDDILDLN